MVVVVVFPVGDDHAGMGQRPEAVDIEAFVADAGVERFDVPSRQGSPGGMKYRPTCPSAQSAIAVQANSGPLSHVLAVLLDRLGRYEPAATITGFATINPMAATTLPELGTAITEQRDVLGDQTYESLARKGETMTTAAMVTYAYDQIDQARIELEHPG